MTKMLLIFILSFNGPIIVCIYKTFPQNGHPQFLTNFTPCSACVAKRALVLPLSVCKIRKKSCKNGLYRYVVCLLGFPSDFNL